MHLIQAVLHSRKFNYILYCIVLVSVTACSSSVQTVTSPSQQSAPVVTSPLLPGQQIWKKGVSSFLFGTNDSYEWSTHNIQTEPAIQQALRTAGFTLIRSFFPDNASDAVIEQRIRTIENSGAHCLGVITNTANTQFDEHLVRYLGNRCLMYEFGNESDINGVSIGTYLARWNSLIPILRHINPAAKFIGPVTYNDQGNHGYMQEFLEGVKTSGVLPDAVSFHWYPCYFYTESACLSQATSYAQVALGVRMLVRSILGKDIPVGISEWNYDPSNPPPAYGDNAGFMTQFSAQALVSMMSAGVAFACQFDAADYGGYGRLDMFNVETNQPKPQYYAISSIIQQYRTT